VLKVRGHQGAEIQIQIPDRRSDLATFTDVAATVTYCAFIGTCAFYPVGRKSLAGLQTSKGQMDVGNPVKDS
jgi:hypothetical protein